MRTEFRRHHNGDAARGRIVRWLPLLLATGVGVGTAPARAQPATGGLVVSVTDAAGSPLAGAQVTVLGVRRGGLTNAEGWLGLAGLPPGEQVVEVQLLGYRTEQRLIELARGATLALAVALIARPIALEPLQVNARPRRVAVGAMREFYQRRERGIGHFLTRADIERQQAKQMSDLLRTIPGVKLTCYSLMETCRAGMHSAPESVNPDLRAAIGSRAELSCPVQYYVDGVYQPQPDINLIRVDDVEAVEVYVHGHGAPARYSIRKNARCGVILIWMRMSLN